MQMRIEVLKIVKALHGNRRAGLGIVTGCGLCQNS